MKKKVILHVISDFFFQFSEHVDEAQPHAYLLGEIGLLSLFLILLRR